MWYSHTMEYHSGRNRNDGPLSATTCMHLENIMLNQRTNHYRPHLINSHLCDMSRKGKSTETETRLTITWDQEDEGLGESVTEGYGVSLEGVKLKCSKTDGGDGVTTL